MTDAESNQARVFFHCKILTFIWCLLVRPEPTLVEPLCIIVPILKTLCYHRWCVKLSRVFFHCKILTLIWYLLVRPTLVEALHNVNPVLGKFYSHWCWVKLSQSIFHSKILTLVWYLLVRLEPTLVKPLCIGVPIFKNSLCSVKLSQCFFIARFNPSLIFATAIKVRAVHSVQSRGTYQV